jgi:hypothetical protein
VTPARRRTLLVLATAVVAGVGAGVAIGLIEDDGDEPSAGSEPALPAGGDPAQAEPRGGASPGPGDDSALPPEEDDPQGAEPGPSGPAPESAEEQAAATAARGYVQALDRRSGGAVCRALAPGVLDRIRFPAPRSSCPASVEASLGFERRGFPVWEHSRMTGDLSAEVTGDSARIVATVFTVYADVPEPTIEDDIIYLERDGGRWLVTKPSLTLYRAIGDADPPPSALSP